MFARFQKSKFIRMPGKSINIAFKGTYTWKAFRTLYTFTKMTLSLKFFFRRLNSGAFVQDVIHKKDGCVMPRYITLKD